MSVTIVEKIGQENSPSFAFSHPVQTDWADKDIPDVAIEALDERFRGTFIHPSHVIDALVRVTNLVTKRRADLEKEHSNMVFPDMQAFNRYFEMAGDPNRALELLEHFSVSAEQSMLVDAEGKDRAINLGGNRQYGFMNATEITDFMSTLLKKQLQRKYGNSRIRTYEKGEHDLLRYAFEYYIPLTNPMPDEEPQFGIITRRRPVVDFDKTRVFKESVGLIVLSGLSKTTQEKMYEEAMQNFELQSDISRLEISKATVDHRYEKPFTAHDAKLLEDLKRQLSHSFTTAGSIFEQAIAVHDDAGTEVVPVSAHYIARMRRSDLEK